MASINWKEHPLAIATISIVATITIVVSLYKEVILPTHIKSYLNDISELESKIKKLEMSILNDLNEQNSKIENHKNNELVNLSNLKKIHLADLDKLNANYELANKGLIECNDSLSSYIVKNKALSERISDFENSQIFITENPYPSGLGSIRIGDPLSKIKKIFNINSYPNVKVEIKNNPSYVTVSNGHGFFNDITYYLDEKSPDLIITHINFSAGFSGILPDDDFLALLENAFGKADSNPKEGYYSWNANFDTNIYVFPYLSSSYLLFSNRYTPRLWP